MLAQNPAQRVNLFCHMSEVSARAKHLVNFDNTAELQFFIKVNKKINGLNSGFHDGAEITGRFSHSKCENIIHRESAKACYILLFVPTSCSWYSLRSFIITTQIFHRGSWYGNIKMHCRLHKSLSILVNMSIKIRYCRWLWLYFF